jgi:tetratricopeptide (TPR) repeat protein
MRQDLSELRASIQLPTRPGPPLLLMLSLWMLAVSLNTPAGQTLSPTSYQTLTEVHEQIDQQAYEAARRGLQGLLRDVQLHPYEKAVALQTLGYVEVSREDYPAAIRAFAQSLALKQLPDDTQQRLRYDLAQLHMAEDQAAKATQLLEAWFQGASDPPAEAYALLGHAYARQQRYRQAIPPLARAIELAGKAPADWYEALLAMHYELHAYRDCVPLLRDMIRLFPERRRYWQQLAGVHLALKEFDAALTALELAYRDSALRSEQEVIQLVQLYLYTGIPYKAARLLEQQMRAGKIDNNASHRELLARAWSDARQRLRAIEALEKATTPDSKPELRLRLAQWYMEDERWQAATSALAPLVRDTDYDSTGQAWLLLGIARFEQNDPVAAREAFLNAAQSSDTAASARQWLEFIATSSAENLETSHTKKSGPTGPP